MMAAKAKYEKEDGIVAFHSYQSFAPGEVSPEIAHEIGVKLAERLWGERTELKTQIRAVAGEGNPYTTKDNPRYQQINQRLKTLRREVMQCGRIDERSRSLASRIERIEQDEDRGAQQLKSKETTRHGRNRTGH
jgi:capsule polysaccharide export protein KpsE/RkpR